MSIRDEAQAEAERRYPPKMVQLFDGEFDAEESRRYDFTAGALWQSSREPDDVERLTGHIVTATIEDGVRAECGLEDCECPQHLLPLSSEGVYVTVKLDDENAGVGFWDVVLTRRPSPLSAVRHTREETARG